MNAPAVSPSTQALLSALAQAPFEHDFFHTLRRLEATEAAQPRLGRALRPSQEPLRLGQDPELDFAPAGLSSLTAGRATPPRLGVRFFGLFGPQGPMPLHLTEFVRERARHHADPGLMRFADVFHHRLLLLFYRAWAEAQPVTHADRPQDDRYSRWLAALAGLAPKALHGRSRLADDTMRFHAGTLSRGPKNAEGLCTVLHQQFGVPARVEPFVGHWMPLRPQDQTRLGAASSTAPGAGPTFALGQGAVAGHQVWDRQSKFRVHLGPLSLAQYRSFLPGQATIGALRDWIRQHVGLARAGDLRLTLAGHEVPQARLAGPKPQAGDTQLGWTTWLPGGPQRHRSDLILNLDQLNSSAQACGTQPESHHV